MNIIKSEKVEFRLMFTHDPPLTQKKKNKNRNRSIWYYYTLK